MHRDAQKDLQQDKDALPATLPSLGGRRFYREEDAPPHSHSIVAGGLDVMS